MVDSVFPIAVLLAVVVRAIVDYLIAPVRKRYPGADLWYLVYVSFGVGAVIGWLSGVNLFADIATLPLALGRILTAACIGGGANLLHDLATRRNEKPVALEDEGAEVIALTEFAVALDNLKWRDTDADPFENEVGRT